jgi:hypothetical protein
VITRHLEYIEELYKIAENDVDPSKVDSQKLDNIQSKYQKKMNKHGTEIKKIACITREECLHYLYENTDFMPVGIKYLIKEGQSQTNRQGGKWDSRWKAHCSLFRPQTIDSLLP